MEASEMEMEEFRVFQAIFDQQVTQALALGKSVVEARRWAEEVTNVVWDVLRKKSECPAEHFYGGWLRHSRAINAVRLLGQL
jgi:hypothetical protein